MLELLKVHGFRTLVNTEIRFDPLTIMIGKTFVITLDVTFIITT